MAFWDISDLRHGTMTFQEYYLILLLIAALIFAALIHCKETWVLAHGLSYLLGFPAMQILLPIYAICNMVDQSWGTRDQVSQYTLTYAKVGILLRFHVSKPLLVNIHNLCQLVFSRTCPNHHQYHVSPKTERNITKVSAESLNYQVSFI